jgi:hypothetical protein
VNFGAGAAQQLAALIELRNTLVHHKPVMVEHGRESHESDDPIERKLNGRFELSRLCGVRSRLRPAADRQPRVTAARPRIELSWPVLVRLRILKFSHRLQVPYCRPDG